MASTFTNLGLELMADGENANTWGEITNDNWNMVEEALTGTAEITISGDYTLTGYSDGVSGNNARKFFLRFIGTLSANATVTLPTNDKIYGVQNATSGSKTITFSCGSGDNVTVGNAKSAIIHTAVTNQHCRLLTESFDDAVIPSSWTNTAQSILALTDVASSIGTAGQVLKVNSGATALEFADDSSGSGAAIANVVEDTTPQLGGTLDANGKSIDMGNNTITDAKVAQWDTAYSWGDHGLGNYSTSSGISASSVPGYYAQWISTGTGSSYQIAIGGYAILAPQNTTTYAVGETEKGENLKYAGAVDIDSSGNSINNLQGATVGYGTWTCMGHRSPGGNYTSGWHHHAVALFLRTS